MFFWHRRISIIIVSSSRHLQRSVSPAEILHPLEASDTHSQAPPGWLTGRRDQARMLTNVVSPIKNTSIGDGVSTIYWVYHRPHTDTTHTNMFRIFQMVCFWVEEIQGGTRLFFSDPHLKHINSSKRTFRHSRCNPSTKNHRGQSTNS